jgi:hypothetical protein
VHTLMVCFVHILLVRYQHGLAGYSTIHRPGTQSLTILHNPQAWYAVSQDAAQSTGLASPHSHSTPFEPSAPSLLAHHIEHCDSI